MPTIADQQSSADALDECGHDTVQLNLPAYQHPLGLTKRLRGIRLQTGADFIKPGTAACVHFCCRNTYDCKVGCAQGVIALLVFVDGLIVLWTVDFHDERAAVRRVDQEVDAPFRTLFGARKRVQRGLRRSPAHCLRYGIHQPACKEHALLRRAGVGQARVRIGRTGVNQHARIDLWQPRRILEAWAEIARQGRFLNLFFQASQS